MSLNRLGLLVGAVAMTLAPSAMADEFFVGVEGNSWAYNGQFNENIVLEIMPGDTVTWQWTSFHNVVSGVPSDGPNGNGIFRSGNPQSPGEFSFTFGKPGVYPYFCQLHGSHGMVSSVTVLGDPPCPPDWNGDGFVNSQDLFDFLGDFFELNADFNGDELTNSQDMFDFLVAFFEGC
jgi:plastocyanin